MGFGKGSSNQAGQGGLGSLCKHRRTQGVGMAKGTRKEQGIGRGHVPTAFSVPSPQMENAKEGI